MIKTSKIDIAIQGAIVLFAAVIALLAAIGFYVLLILWIGAQHG